MYNNKVFVLVIVFCSYLHYTELLPIPEPQTVWTNVNTGDRTAETEFMVNNGVTQEEIEEFHRLNGLAPPSELDNGEHEIQGRTFGRIAQALKFWNWSAFENFRQWIEERRRRTTTIRPIPVYIVSNPDNFSYPYNNIY